MIWRKRGKAEAVKEKVDQVDALPRTDLVLSFTNHFVAFNYRNLEPRQLEPKGYGQRGLYRVGSKLQRLDGVVDGPLQDFSFLCKSGSPDVAGRLFGKRSGCHPQKDSGASHQEAL